MKKTLKVALLLITWTAADSSAQLGSNELQCENIWGSPIGGKLDESKCGLLNYYSKEISIELNFYNGTVFRAHYKSSNMDDQNIDRLLQLNDNQVEWDIWRVPGLPIIDKKPTQWMRSDERAMAKLNNGTLSILGPPPVENQKPQRELSNQSQQPSPSAPPSKKEPTKSTENSVFNRPQPFPVVGDSREHALQLLGDPTGTMIRKNAEILIYKWGNIWVEHGVVISIN